jgi:hypothetical protein
MTKPTFEDRWKAIDEDHMTAYLGAEQRRIEAVGDAWRAYQAECVAIDTARDDARLALAREYPPTIFGKFVNWFCKK